MRLTGKSNLNLTSYIQQGNRLLPAVYSQSPEEINMRYNAQLDKLRREDVRLARSYQTEKPDWFLRNERRARRFVQSLGLEAAKGTQVTCIAPRTPKEFDAVMGEGFYEEGVLAIYSVGMGVLVPLSHAEECVAQADGEAALTSTIAHELVHAAEFIEPRMSEVRADSANGTWLGYNSRHGLTIDKLNTYLGSFFQEGICNVVGGLYIRRLANHASELCSIDDEPCPDRPVFYTRGLPERPSEKPYALGFDGYALEMLSWKASKLGITATKNTLLEDMLASHSTDSAVRLAAFRSIPRIINDLEPGLYRSLQQLQRDRFVWRNAMQSVYDIVTK